MRANEPITQEEIDAAIVACLRIFAARGRTLREERKLAECIRQACEPISADQEPTTTERKESR